MTGNHYQSRLDALFADVERLAANPMSDINAVRFEIEKLRERMNALQEEIATNAKPAAEETKSEPIVEEKKRRGASVREGTRRLRVR